MKKLTTHLLFPIKKSFLQHGILLLVVCMSLIFFTGCAKVNVGHDFPDDQVTNIQIGKTTKEEIRTIFGEPWRVGLENGLETWTYGKYAYNGFKETAAKDLVVRYTGNDIVESYTFSKINR